MTVYQGQFGDYTITASDRWEVMLYRSSLAVMAFCFSLGSLLVLDQGGSSQNGEGLTILYTLFCLALGVSLKLIHIYLIPLQRLLQICWGIGCLSSVAIGLMTSDPLWVTLYTHPVTLWGVGFLFVALNGIFFKEAFCFHRIETKILTPLVPILVLGHMMGILPIEVEKVLLLTWSGLFVVFALRKVWQAIPDDIGDKSVFDYLHGRLNPSQGSTRDPIVNTSISTGAV
jgi:uncharacterized integral membrane protein